MECCPSGIFRSDQAVQTYGRSKVRRWVYSGAWVRPFRGVYVSADLGLTDRLRVQAASVAVDHKLVVVRESAAVIHGFGVLGADPVHLAGDSATTARSQPGLQIHGWQLRPGETQSVAGVQVAAAARTAVDVARTVDRLDALPVVDAALRVNACTVDDLRAQLITQAGERGIVAARQLIEWGNAAADSPMESRARLRILDSDLPRPQVQWWVRNSAGVPIYRLDLAWPEYRVGLEYDGSDHLSRTRQRKDIERRSWLFQAGWRVLWVTDIDVYRQYLRMIARLWDLIRARDHADRAAIYGVSSTQSA
jgi:very-short-patch-repair endonuclease